MNYERRENVIRIESGNAVESNDLTESQRICIHVTIEIDSSKNANSEIVNKTFAKLAFIISTIVATIELAMYIF